MKTGDDLKAIKEYLEIINHKIDLMRALQTSQSATIHLMKDLISVINKKVDSK